MLNGYNKHNHPIDRLTEVIAVLSGIALYPQLFKIFITRDVAGLAPTTFFILCITNAVWIMYGIHRKSVPVILASSLSLVAASAIVIMFLAFTVFQKT